MYNNADAERIILFRYQVDENKKHKICKSRKSKEVKRNLRRIASEWQT